MSEHYHAVVWIDHHAARVLHFNLAEATCEVIHPAHPVRHIHHRAGSRTGARAAEDRAFYHEVAAAIADAGSILITGPANAKVELIKHLHRHCPGVLDRLAAVETVDHPTDGELLDHARRVLMAFDRMQPQRAASGGAAGG